MLSQLDIETEVEQHIKMLESAPRSSDVLAKARYGAEVPEDDGKSNKPIQTKTKKSNPSIYILSIFDNVGINKSI